MRSINIGISHDNNFVIPQLAYIKILMNTGAKRGNHSFYFFISENSVKSCLLNI